jgi:histidinol-phosphate aminotransferase
MAFRAEQFLRRGIDSLQAYVPGRGIDEVAKEYSLSEVFKLASNENAWGPSPAALRAIQGVLEGLHRYPDGGASVLRGRLAQKLGVAESEIFAGNGGDDVLSVLARTFLNEGDEVIIPRPTFSPYAHVSRVMGARIVFSPLRDFRIDLEDVLSRAGERTKLVFLCSPNNPTGTIIPESDLLAFLENLPGGVLVLLDEAYGDFVEDPAWPDSLALIHRFPLIVLRSFSKIYGLAGLRVGFGIGDSGLIGYMDRVREPFNVNQLAQAAAAAALGDDEFRARIIREVARERKRYAATFEEMGLEFIESQANFVFVRVGDGDGATEALARRGLIVRPGGAFGCPEWIRVTVGVPEENARLIEALAQILPSGGGS